MDHVPDPAISMTGLTKRYGPVTALERLSLDVPQGSVFGFLGPNGAGKTTAMKILAGLIRPTEGSATIAGRPVTVDGGHRRSLGYLAQDPSFYGWMTGRQTLRYVASFYPAIERPEGQVDELIRLVGLDGAADRKTRTYSGGMLQRLGIAQALVGRPPVVILDEPAAALDPLGRRDVLALLERLRGHATVLYSTHILDDVQRVSDRVAILDHGRLVRASATDELMASFSQDRLSVVLGGADDSTAVALATLDGVAGVTPGPTVNGARSFEVATRPDAGAAAQAAITGFAAAAGLVLMRNEPQNVDLESIFVRLIDHEEVAA
jgi:ABC-2 type transport system ATP-binding protein